MKAKPIGPPPPSRRRRGARKEPTKEELASRVLRDLRSLGRKLSEERGLGRGEAFPSGGVVLPLSVPLSLNAGPEGDEDEADQLIRDMEGRVGELMRAHRAFLHGRVYCFLCDDPDCSHARPGDLTETFVGYTPTGKPVWQSFVNLCLERGEPRVDRLYGDRPEVIALVQGAKELKGRLLPSFGRGSLAFNVIGQVVAGLLPLDLRPGRTTEARVALTFQFLETWTGQKNRRLRLNILGLTLDQIAEAASMARPREPAERLRRIISATRQQLESWSPWVENADRQGKIIDLEAKVRPLIHGIRSDVEGMFRSSQQRTIHAQERHIGGERPTAYAMEDAQKAPFERILEDVLRNTIVVLGPRGRAHVFSPRGSHVTSLQLRPGEVERKSHMDRWRPLPRDKAAAFQGKIIREPQGETAKG